MNSLSILLVLGISAFQFALSSPITIPQPAHLSVILTGIPEIYYPYHPSTTAHHTFSPGYLPTSVPVTTRLESSFSDLVKPVAFLEVEIADEAPRGCPGKVACFPHGTNEPFPRLAPLL